MPSDVSAPGDPMVAQALQAVARPREAFDTALALTAEEIRGFLDSHRNPESDGPERLATELGQFASNLIDPDRFASLVTPRQPTDVEALHEAERGWAGLLALRARGEDLHVVRAPAGSDVVDVVKDALSEAGKAFRLARTVRFVRNGSASPDTPSSEPFPPRLWSSAERALAPPLVVEAEGADMGLAGLGDLLVGSQKLILLLPGAAAPAPLSYLVRPGLLVIQVTDPGRLGGFADFDGPGIAAVMPAGAAVFSHDPRRGDSYATRLVVESTPENGGRDPTDPLSPHEDLRHLIELSGTSRRGEDTRDPSRAAPMPEAAGEVAGTPAPPASAIASTMPAVTVTATSTTTAGTGSDAGGATPASGSSPQEADPADRLAAWLLDQAGL